MPEVGFERAICVQVVADITLVIQDGDCGLLPLLKQYVKQQYK